VPADIIVVAESGMKCVEDVRAVASAGADAVLVGSELSASANPDAAVRSLGAVKRSARAGKG
jgi:indole-3-glycerol phosphate synthase